MSDFASWLHDRKDDDPEIAELKAAAAANAAAGPYYSNSRDDYLTFNSKHVAEAKRQRVSAGLGAIHAIWTAQSLPESIQKTRVYWTPQNVIFSVFGLVIIGSLFVALLDEEVGEQLKDPEYIRGMITYLFAFSTILLAVVIAITIFGRPLTRLESALENLGIY